MDKSNQQDTQHWAHKKERGSLFGIYFLVYTFKLFGAKLCKVFLIPVLIYFYLFNRATRNNLIEYLQKVQQNQKGKNVIIARQKNVFKIILNFGFGMIDRLSSLMGRLPYESINSINIEKFREMEKNKKGAVLLISHLGNFEICRAASGKRSNSKFNIVIHNQNSQKINKAFKTFNNDKAITLVQEKELSLAGIINLKEKIDNGEYLVIAGDRIPVSNEKGTIECEFLGEKARFPIGPYVLSKVLACPMINIFCLKNGKKYDLFFHYLTDKMVFTRATRLQNINKALKQYVKNLECHIRQTPLQWYNFHNFWENQIDKKSDK